MTASCGSIGSLIVQVQNDFLAVPGLTLTLRGAQRRFGVDEITCEAILATLVDAGVLTRTREGVYARRFARAVSRARTARGSTWRPSGTRRFAEHAA